MIYYIRDDNNNLIGFKTNNTTYYYKKNYQNDIIGIYDNNYNLIVSYEYDDYGSILSIKDNTGIEITDPNHIGNINPFRYRSYYYDKETNLYYLNSRYYNPEWGRFINIDNSMEIGKNLLYLNLYLYTNNNYINAYDYSGAPWNSIWDGIKNGAKVIGSGIKNVYNSAKKTVNNIWTGVKNSFTCEVDVGVSAGASVANIGIEFGAKQSMNAGVSNGKTYSNTSYSAGFEAGIKKSDFNIDLSYNKIHNTECSNPYHNNPAAPLWEIINCPYTTNDIYLNTEHTELHKDEIFIGFSVDAYLGFGVSFKIGFNIP